MKRVGCLSVSSEYFAERLGLPDGTKIRGIEFDGFVFRVAIESDAMPESDPSSRAQDVIMLIHQTDDVDTGIRTVHGAWSHDPEKKWLIDIRPIPPVPPNFKWPPKEAESAA